MMDKDKYTEDELFFNSNSPERKEDNPQNEHVSSNPYKDALLNYARNRKSLIFLLLHIVIMLLSWILINFLVSLDLNVTQDGRTLNLDLMKVFLVIYFVFVAIIPIGLGMIYQGSIKDDIEKVLKGLKIIEVYLRIILGLIVLSAIVFVITIFYLFLLIQVLAIFLGLIFGLFLWFYFRFFKVQLVFIEECKRTLKTKNSKKNIRPYPLKLKNYVIIWIVVSIISLIANIISNEATLNFIGQTTIDMFRTINILALLTAFLQIVKLFFALYLIQDFNQYLNKIEPDGQESNVL